MLCVDGPSWYWLIQERTDRSRTSLKIGALVVICILPSSPRQNIEFMIKVIRSRYPGSPRGYHADWSISTQCGTCSGGRGVGGGHAKLTIGARWYQLQYFNETISTHRGTTNEQGIVKQFEICRALVKSGNDHSTCKPLAPIAHVSIKIYRRDLLC